MKKAILTVFMIFIVSMSYSLDLYSFGSMSYDYTKVGMNYDPDDDWFLSVLGAGVMQEWNVFTFYAEAETVTEMSLSGVGTESILSFSPTHADYFVRAGLWIDKVFIEYEHLCMHNIDTFDISRNGGHNRVTVGFDTRGK